MKKTAAKGHTRKHAHVTAKHHKTAKHHPTAHQKHLAHLAHQQHIHAVTKPAKHAKARALSPGDVACCTTEALAMSLRLQGLAVTGAEVLDLFRLASGDEDKGMPVQVALEAASEFGLAGVRLLSFESAWPGVIRRDPVVHQAPLDEALNFGNRELPRDALGHQRFDDARAGAFPPAAREFDHVIIGDVGALHGASVILGVDLPGQHAVLATPEGWWSWGELWCPCEFPDAVIEEAWAVTWA